MRADRTALAALAAPLLGAVACSGPPPKRPLRPEPAAYPYQGCFALDPGPWEEGLKLYEGLRQPRWMRLDTVPSESGVWVSYHGELEPPPGAGLSRTFWYLVEGDSAQVFSTRGGWGGYELTFVLEGDSISGRAGETSDVTGRYRTHGLRGVRIPCYDWPPNAPTAADFDLRLVPYSPHPDDPAFSRVTDPVSRVAGLAPLRDVALPPGGRELRLWTGFGLIIPHSMLRIVDDAEGVTGELFFWWSSSEDLRDDPSLNGFWEEMRDVAGRFGCETSPSGARVRLTSGGTTTETREWVAVCRADLGEDAPHWGRFLAELETDDVFTLPRPETLEPGGASVTDGVSLQVEVLDGERYRTYTYSNPDLQPWPEAVRATRILERVLRVGWALLD